VYDTEPVLSMLSVNAILVVSRKFGENTGSPLAIAWHLRGCCPPTGGPICCFFGQTVHAVGLWNLYGNNVYSVYGGGELVMLAQLLRGCSSSG